MSETINPVDAAPAPKRINVPSRLGKTKVQRKTFTAFPSASPSHLPAQTQHERVVFWIARWPNDGLLHLMGTITSEPDAIAMIKAAASVGVKLADILLWEKAPAYPPHPDYFIRRDELVAHLLEQNGPSPEVSMHNTPQFQTAVAKLAELSGKSPEEFMPSEGEPAVFPEASGLGTAGGQDSHGFEV